MQMSAILATLRHLSKHPRTLSTLGQSQTSTRQQLALASKTQSRSFAQQPEEEMDDLKKNPYYAKYAKKLQEKQESNPEEFQSKLDELETKKQEEAEAKQKQLDELIAQKKAQQSKPKTLDSVMRVDLLQDKNVEEISEIWKEYHNSKDCVFAAIPRAEYEEIHKRAQEFPTFVYPVPRGGGYEFFLQQFNGHEIHFTPLVMFQTHKENAPASLIIHHYPELMEDKGIVLMHGYPDSKYLAVHESQLLALQVKLYYGLNSGLKFNFVRAFNNSPAAFRHMDLIHEFECYKKDTVAARNREF